MKDLRKGTKASKLGEVFLPSVSTIYVGWISSIYGEHGAINRFQSERDILQSNYISRYVVI